jgi:FMN-dependent oxidoreductase (nitrilotriacetate monooxygenase family)
LSKSSRTISVNGFAIFSPVHLSPGLWRHPADRSLEFDTLDYWIDVARTLEAGLFDSIFIADGIGIHDVYSGNADAALSSAAQIPKLDPMLLVSAMAHVTRHLGLGVTASVSYEPPFTLARRFSTLDHLTKGRVAWNVVTGYSAAASRAVGRPEIMPHDPRYDLADEFLDAVYALWEGSWDDDAVIADRDAGVFADPSRIRKVHHHGQHFKVDAIHLTHPSPQRTPFLFQAGASDRGKDFAARHAEAVFLGEHSRTRTAATVAETRARAQAFGRDSRDIRFFGLITVVVGETRAAAEAKYRDYQRYTDPRGALALLSGWTGIDLSRYSLDDPFPSLKKDNAVTSMVDSFSSGERVWTIRDIIGHNFIGGRGPVVIGSPTEVADQLQAWIAETDIDGFNLSYAITPDGYHDFIDLVVPELQRRGVYKTEYAPGTLREKIFGAGQARLPATHPAARFRSGASRPGRRATALG